MPNGSIPLSTARQQLAEAVSQAQPSTFEPLDISPWLAMALLQKAVRRGRDEFAQQAAATLLQISPERLWRRCGGIAFEDIGVADLETVSLVTAALAGKTVRADLGGEWPVASFIVSRMAQAPKCRATDDLLMTAELHPAYEQSRRELALRSTADLLTIATGSTALPERALALWYAIGTNRRQSRHLGLRRGEPAAVFGALCDAGFPRTVVEVAREGFRRVGEVLCPFLALLSAISQSGPAAIVDDDLPTSRQFLRLYKKNVKRFRSIYVPRFASYWLCFLWEKYSEWSEGQLPPAFNRRVWRAYWKKTSYSNQKLKAKLGWSPKIPFPEGLSAFFEACRKRGAHA
jgi:hypothetical protein